MVHIFRWALMLAGVMFVVWLFTPPARAAYAFVVYECATSEDLKKGIMDTMDDGDIPAFYLFTKEEVQRIADAATKARGKKKYTAIGEMLVTMINSLPNVVGLNFFNENGCNVWFQVFPMTVFLGDLNAAFGDDPPEFLTPEEFKIKKGSGVPEEQVFGKQSGIQWPGGADNVSEGGYPVG